MIKLASIVFVATLPLTGYAQCAPSLGELGQTAACASAMLSQAATATMAEEAVQAARAKDALSNADTVSQCYVGLGPYSLSRAVAQSINCLQKNPYAGSADVADFLAVNATLIAKLTGSGEAPHISTAIEALVRQKKEKLYWLVTTDTGKTLYVGAAYQFDNPTGSVIDLSAVDPQLIAVSNLFNTHEVVPLKDVKSFSNTQSKPKGDGNFTVTTAGKTFRDSMYLGANSSDHRLSWTHYADGNFPIIRFSDNDRKRPSVLLRLRGTAYAEGRDTFKKENTTLSLNQFDLHGMVVSFMDETAAKLMMDRVEQQVAMQKPERPPEMGAVLIKPVKANERIKPVIKDDEGACRDALNGVCPVEIELSD
jgi:hypothetical protein